MPPSQKALSPRGSILALSSEVGVGAVGLSLARFVFAAQQIPLVQLPTVFFAARPGLGPSARPPQRLDVPKNVLDNQLNALEEDGFLEEVCGVLTGYFSSPGQVDVVAGFLEKLKAKRPELFILIDPILGDFDGGLYVEEKIAVALREKLLPLSHLITPNLYEFLWLAGEAPAANRAAPHYNVRSPDQWLSLLKAVDPQIGKAVVTSAEITPEGRGRSAKTEADGHMKTLLIDDNEVFAFESRYFKGVPKGTGDVFAAILLSRMVSGDTTGEGVRHAVRKLEKIADKAQGMNAIAPYLLL